ncbi:hypothetical protein NPIL_118271 [Nephila pilipes]|uniref:Uncharacterized protein n=1 Tax=Nephila pilipes TaxID=299642 RepID=A0A8X6QBI1_NEPPI|nr:hypothetical protein NPIL_118271 [Nephila pilipes]
MSEEIFQSSSFSNLGQLENEDISLQMGHLINFLNYSGSESNQNVLFDKEQTSMFPNNRESISNETSTHFKQGESSVYNLGVISSEMNESSMRKSNSGIYYPETFSNESISQYVQQSTILLNCPGSISNEIFTDITEQQISVYDPVITTGDKFSYGLEEFKTYLSYPGQMYSENNSSSEQKSSPFWHATSIKSSESISNDMQLSSIRMNYAGSISNDLFTHFTQGETSVYNPVEKISASAYYGKEQSSSYLNYPESIYGENNSSSIQHSITSVDYPVSNSTESASHKLYEVTPVPAYNLGAHTKENISSDIKNSNSYFSNVEYSLSGCMSRDMQNLSSSFRYHEAPSNDNISIENHQTHSASVYPETASRVYKTNDILNSYSSSNYPRSLTLRCLPCGNEQSNGSLIPSGFTSTESVSSDEQYSQPISNTSRLNSGEYISCHVRNTISVSEYPRTMYQETISRDMENTNSSFCIPGNHSNTNYSFNLQESDSIFYHSDRILKKIDSRDTQPSISTISSRELHMNVNNFLEIPNSKTSSLCRGSILNKDCTSDSSTLSNTCNYNNNPINKILDKSTENDTGIHDFVKNNDKIPQTPLNERKKLESIQMEKYSWQCIFGDQNIHERKIIERTPENKIFRQRMEQSNSGIHYHYTFSNESISQYVHQSSIPLNYPGSISNESFTYFTQQQMSVYDLITTSGESVSSSKEQSNSYLNYPGQMYSENNSSSMQQSSSFLHVPILKSDESISNDMQPSLNYTGLISNESFLYFTQQQEPVYNPITTSVYNPEEKVSANIYYGTEQSSEKVCNDRQPSSIRHNNKGTISNESFPYFNQEKNSVYYPVENVSVSTYCGTDQSISYLHYPGYMSRENNSSSTQHSISSLHAPVSNSTETASHKLYAVTPVPTYNLGAHTKKNISSDFKTLNSFFPNVEYSLTAFMSRDMQNLSSPFKNQEAPSNDNISFENHQTQSVYPETATRVYKTNDMLNSYSPSNFPRTLTLESLPCGNKQSNGSLFYPGFTSTETESSDEQYSQTISNTSCLNSGEYISCHVRNTILVSEYPRSMYQETIYHNMENINSSFCILGSCSNTNNSFTLQQLNSAFYHSDSILKENDSRDIQPSSSSIYSTELRKNFTNFLETQNSRTSYLWNGLTLNNNCAIESSEISYNYDNISVSKGLDKSYENDSGFNDFNKINDIIPAARLSERNKFEFIEKENVSRQSISSDRNIYIKNFKWFTKNLQNQTFECEY